MFENKKFSLFFSIAVFLLVFLLYAKTFNYSFQFDDSPTIVENYKIKDMSNFAQVLKSQRGLTMATFMINYKLGELNTWGYHFTNTLIHAINAVLAYFVILLSLNFVTRDSNWNKKVAVFSSILFAVHPIQTQAVTYIVQRMEILSSMFYLLCVLLFLLSFKLKDVKKVYAVFALVVLSFYLGYKSKEIIITLPATLLLLDYLIVEKGNIKNLLKRAPLYIVLFAIAIYIISGVVGQGGFNDLSKATSETSGYNVKVVDEFDVNKNITPAPTAGFGVKSITPKEYFYTQQNVILYYLTLLLIPANQNIDYDFPRSSSFFAKPKLNEGTVLNIPIPPPVVSFLILLSIIGFCIYLSIKGIKDKEREDKRCTLLPAFFMFWFFIIISPTSSFMPIVDVIFEHRIYLASLGYFVVFVIVLEYLIDLIAEKLLVKKPE